MRVSIIIPTYNRADVLSISLREISRLRRDLANYEVLVVDNASNDHTRTICRDFAVSHPEIALRYLLEVTQGVSYARNRGVKESQGEIVCFLDDDSPPVPEWLDFLLEPFFDSKTGCVGGPSILDFQGQVVPDWLQGDVQGLLSGYKLPFDEQVEVSRWQDYPLSCNLAIRRRLFDELGYFRTDLDRSGSQVLAAGDTEMIDRIHKAGWKVVYAPNAAVNHLVSSSRLTKEHVYRIGRGLAESHVILTNNRNPLMLLRWFASDMWYSIRMLFQFLIALITKKPRWFDDYMRLWMVSQRLPIRFMKLFG